MARSGCRILTYVWSLMALLGLLSHCPPVRAQPADDLAWIPSDAAGFVSLRIADLWRHESTKELRQQFAKAPLDLEKELETNLGVHPKEIERVSFLILPHFQETVFALTTTKPMREKLVATLLPNAKEKQHQGKTYWEADALGLAICAVDERVYLGGSTKSVLDLLDRAAAKKVDGPLREGLQLAKQKTPPLVASINLSALSKKLKGALPPQAEAALPLFDANPAVLTILSDTNTVIHARLTCANEQDAKTKAQTLRITLDILRQFIPIGRVELGKQKSEEEVMKWLLQKADTFLTDLQDACKAAKVEAKGQVVHGEMRLKSPVGTLLTLTAGFLFSVEGGGAAPVKPGKP